MAFSPDGKTPATGGRTNVKLWDMADVLNPELQAAQARVAASECLEVLKHSGLRLGILAKIGHSDFRGPVVLIPRTGYNLAPRWLEESCC